MSESEKRRQPCWDWDRLSELPDSMIFEIFGLLPMRDIVRTTVLSKRWKNLWTTTPYLNFDYHSSEFINGALTLWKGFKILILKIGFGSVHCDIDLWMRLAKDHGIEELFLKGRALDEVPHDLYSCSSLKVLSLCYVKLRYHGIVQLNQLRSLTIVGCDIDEHLMNQVVSSSPRLEVFFLDLLVTSDNLSIRSTSLKNLWISRQDRRYDYPSSMRLWSPNLETLNLEGEPYDKYLLMNVSSLTHLKLDSLYADVLVGEGLWQIFSTIQHVEKLTISRWSIEGIGAMKGKYLLSPLSSFKFLTIEDNDVKYEAILDFLQIFPKLEMLVLRSEYLTDLENNYDTEFLQVERNLPKSFLLQLRIVEITWTDCDDLILPFIKFLLKHAKKLQKMVIRVQGIKPPSMPWDLAQKLLRMPRSSPAAELIFAEY